MKNSLHHLKHLIKKSVRKNTQLPVTLTTYDELIKRMQIYRQNWGDLQMRPRNRVKKVFHDYIHYITNHPSSTASKHSRRASPGMVSGEGPHTRNYASDDQTEHHTQSKLQEANLKLSKKLMKTSKVRWKKID